MAVVSEVAVVVASVVVSEVVSDVVSVVTAVVSEGEVVSDMVLSEEDPLVSVAASKTLVISEDSAGFAVHEIKVKENKTQVKRDVNLICLRILLSS